MEKSPITKEGFDALQNKLAHLQNIKRPEVIEAIRRAKEFGDLSENAEYHEAKKEQGLIERRISELLEATSKAEIIDVKNLNGNTAKFGATVTLLDQTNDKTLIYKIVGELEADIDQGLLSISSPLGRSLINKKVGDYIEVTIPSGEKLYELLNLEFK